ncbi:MAG: hypothetical protein JNM72_25180 [Deltaproteobacteria bacterium]|nr:hypothetical protein [Deltaproteobacteria bacterium]
MGGLVVRVALTSIFGIVFSYPMVWTLLRVEVLDTHTQLMNNDVAHADRLAEHCKTVGALTAGPAAVEYRKFLLLDDLDTKISAAEKSIADHEEEISLQSNGGWRKGTGERIRGGRGAAWDAAKLLLSKSVAELDKYKSARDNLVTSLPVDREWARVRMEQEREDSLQRAADCTATAKRVADRYKGYIKQPNVGQLVVALEYLRSDIDVGGALGGFQAMGISSGSAVVPTPSGSNRVKAGWLIALVLGGFVFVDILPVVMKLLVQPAGYTTLRSSAIMYEHINGWRRTAEVIERFDIERHAGRQGRATGAVVEVLVREAHRRAYEAFASSYSKFLIGAVETVQAEIRARAEEVVASWVRELRGGPNRSEGRPSWRRAFGQDGVIGLLLYLFHQIVGLADRHSRRLAWATVSVTGFGFILSILTPNPEGGSLSVDLAKDVMVNNLSEPSKIVLLALLFATGRLSWDALFPKTTETSQ